MKRFSLINKLILAILLTLPVMSMAQFTDSIQNYRYYDQRGINVFETPKESNIQFSKVRVRFGAGFTQQFQNLKHENPSALNTGAPPASGTKALVTTNHLYPLKPGFMTAQANLFMDVQLAEGISLNVTTYLSARHHNEAWVKGGYIQIDKLPFKGKTWEDISKIATIKIGHMEINYGDAHFRRSDGGQSLYNPFMESYILDAYATEIGGEVYLKKNGAFAMIGLTSGMIKGNVDSTTPGIVNGNIVDANTKRSPSLYFKAGIDKQLTDDIRVRVSGSYYHNGSSAGSGLTLYGGDRTGSNYQNVMEIWKTPVFSAEKSTETSKVYDAVAQASTATAFSGRLNPGFGKKVDAIMLNGFLKIKGLELFGTYETASGRTKTETDNRKANQLAGDVVYRFGKSENLFVGARYNTASARLAGYTSDVKVDRTALAGGWFLTKNVLLKGEYVIQNYKKFPTTDYRSGGKFNGYVIEASIGF